jgi:hypothetical protein
MTTLFENHYVRGEDAFLLEMTVSEVRRFIPFSISFSDST